MARRTVVMEMGHRALHGLLVEKRLGELMVVDYHLEDLPGDPLVSIPAGPEASNPAWAGLFQNWPFSREGILTAFPGELCTFRLLELPFQQPKKIAQTIAYEAENYLPFDLDDILLEYLPAWRRDSAGGGSTGVLVAGAGREQFGRFLNGLLEAGLDPAQVSASGLCLFALSRLEAKNGVRCRGYLDLGARQSRLCVVRDGMPIHVGSLAFGGDDLTRLLSEEFHLSWEQAESGKKLEARVGEDPAALPAQEARLVRLLEQGLAPLWRWLEHNWRWLERRQSGAEEPARCEELVLCGGTANLRGLAAAMEEKFGVPTRVFRLPAAVVEGGRPVPEELQPALAEPLALALLDSPKRGETAINFRKGEFAYRRESQIYREKLMLPGVLVLAMFMLMVARYGVARTGVAQQIREIQNRMKEQVQAQLGVPPNGDPVEFVEAKLKEAQAKLDKYQGLKSPRAMEVFAACSEKIPIEVLLELSKYTYNGDKVQLEGETSDFSKAKEIQDFWATVPFFTKVTLEDTRQAASGRTHFNVQISLQTGAPAPSAGGSRK